MSHRERDFAGHIRAHGYRYTPQRQLILDTLCRLGRHATVDEIYTALQETAPSISLATLYRTLSFLQSLRLVVSADIHGETVYELAPAQPHHHLICRDCGHIAPLDGYHLDELVTHLADEHGFQAHLDHLAIPGLCALCQDAGSPA